jgi:hypothetical protein
LFVLGFFPQCQHSNEMRSLAMMTMIFSRIVLKRRTCTQYWRTSVSR